MRKTVSRTHEENESFDKKWGAGSVIYWIVGHVSYKYIVVEWKLPFLLSCLFALQLYFVCPGLSTAIKMSFYDKRNFYPVSTLICSCGKKELRKLSSNNVAGQYKGSQIYF